MRITLLLVSDRLMASAKSRKTLMIALLGPLLVLKLSASLA